MIPAIYFFVAYLLCTVAYAMSTAVVGSLLGLPHEEVDIFVGPTIIRIEYRGRIYRLNWLPLGSSVKFRGDDLENASVFRVLLTVLAGCAALCLLAIVCLPGSDGLWMIVAGFGQIFSGSICPLSHGRDLLIAAVDFVCNRGFIMVLGATAAKLCATNLLPIPSLAGGHVLLTIWKSISGQPENTMMRLQCGGVLLLMAMMVSWIIAVGSALLTLMAR